MDTDNGGQPGKAVAYGDAGARTSVGVNYAHAEAEGTKCAAAVSGGRDKGAYGVVSGKGAYLRITQIDQPVKEKKPKKVIPKNDSASITGPNETKAFEVKEDQRRGTNSEVWGDQHRGTNSVSHFGADIQSRLPLNTFRQSLDTNVDPGRETPLQADVCERDHTPPSDLKDVNSSTDKSDGIVVTQQGRSVIPLSSRVGVWGGAVVVVIISALIFVFIEGPEPTPPIIPVPDEEQFCLHPWNDVYDSTKNKFIDPTPPDDSSSPDVTNDDTVIQELEMRPRNTISKKDEVTRLNCSVSNGFVQWSKLEGHGRSVKLISLGDQIVDPMGSDTTLDKFQIDRPAEGRFDLLISNVQLSDAGTYVCYVGSRGGAPQPRDHEILADDYTAPVQLLVVDDDLNCKTTIPPDGEVMELDPHVIKCEIRFEGKGKPELNWAGLDSIAVQKHKTGRGWAWTMANISSFDQSMQEKVITVQATFENDGTFISWNGQSWNSTYTTPPLNIFARPRNVIITSKRKVYYVGESISCSAEAQPDPRLFWYNTRTQRLVCSDSLNITEGMLGERRTYECWATNMIGGRNYTSKSGITFSVPDCPRDFIEVDGKCFQLTDESNDATKICSSTTSASLAVLGESEGDKQDVLREISTYRDIGKCGIIFAHDPTTKSSDCQSGFVQTTSPGEMNDGSTDIDRSWKSQPEFMWNDCIVSRRGCSLCEYLGQRRKPDGGASLQMKLTKIANRFYNFIVSTVG